MNIFNNMALADYSTMHLGGVAAHLAEITSRNDLLSALAWADQQQLPVIMVGGGSNIYWRDEGFQGLVLVNRVQGYEDFGEDDLNHYITAGAGEIWDSVVERTVQAGLTGIEALSLIPGTVGGTPIQNVGAYGQRVSSTITTVEAYDRQLGKFVMLPGNDCAFGYRASRFKHADKGRFFITAVTFHLQKGNPEPPFYNAVQEYFDAHNIKAWSPAVLREAVIAIRKNKLPDPSVVSNCGSFFANPIVDEFEAARLRESFPVMPVWPGDNSTFKIPAAWLIEQAGLKGFHDDETGMATWPNHALVLVNEHARNTADLNKFKQKIVTAVQQKFGIKLEQEPELLP
jgi:UDP-N-acetylmuramate dehydrogenase